MREQNENRRVRMTKQLMKNALLELLEQRELVNITVTAICQTADVHRSTFYKYYTDPADLLKDVEQDILDLLPSPPELLNLENPEQLLTTTTVFFDNVKRNEKSLRILFNKRTGNHLAAKLIEYFCSGDFPVGTDADELSAHFIRLYIACGTIGMLREWVCAGFPVSSRKIAEMMYFFSKKVVS